MDYHLIISLLVKFVANASAEVDFTYDFFSFPIPFLPSQTEVSQLTVYFSLLYLLPLQCCRLVGGCYLLFFLLMFLPYYCFNNVKTQVLACSLWLVPICFSYSIFLAAVLYPFLPLVFWYLIADAKPSINSRLLERIAERKWMQQRFRNSGINLCISIFVPIFFFFYFSPHYLFTLHSLLLSCCFYSYVFLSACCWFC